MNQRQIAEDLGISQTSVSMVLNNPSTRKVSSDKRKQILNYLRETKYLLRNHGGITWNIGYLIGGIVDVNSPFYNRFFAGIEKSASDAGYNIMIERYRPGESKMLNQHKVDGVIVEVLPNVIDVSKISDNLPSVLLNNSCREIICDMVVPDNTGGVFIAVKHLKDLGHERIALIDLTRPYDFCDMDMDMNQIEIRDGFRAAWRFYFPSQALAEEYVKTPRVINGNSIPATEEVISRILDDFLAMPDCPTAIICADTYAKILISLAHEKGIKIPGQLSVIGLDNTNECEYCVPPLTSVDHNLTEMGRMAVELLLRRINDPERPFVKQYCDSRLVLRKSSGPCINNKKAKNNNMEKEKARRENCLCIN